MSSAACYAMENCTFLASIECNRNLLRNCELRHCVIDTYVSGRSTYYVITEWLLNYWMDTENKYLFHLLMSNFESAEKLKPWSNRKIEQIPCIPVKMDWKVWPIACKWNRLRIAEPSRNYCINLITVPFVLIEATSASLCKRSIIQCMRGSYIYIFAILVRSFRLRNPFPSFRPPSH